MVNKSLDHIYARIKRLEKHYDKCVLVNCIPCNWFIRAMSYMQTLNKFMDRLVYNPGKTIPLEEFF